MSGYQREREQWWAEFRAAVRIRQVKADAIGKVKQARHRMKTRQAGFDWERAWQNACEAYGWAKKRETELREEGLRRGFIR